jgi:transposase-like protein
MATHIAPADLTLSKIAKHYSDEDAAYEYVESVRWSYGPVCPHCGVIDEATYLDPKDGPRKTRTGKVSNRRVWQCNACRQQFSVLVGTIFEDSHIPLSKWLLGIHLMCAGKNGVSAKELERQLGIAYRSAWFMAHRIRYAMAHESWDKPLEGTVEADETYIGGKAHGKRGRGAANKTPVVSLVERGGEVRSQMVTNVTGKNVKEVLEANVSPDATLMTDSYQVYTEPGKAFADHQTVDHGKNEYVRGDAYTNTVEGYFSQLKRSIDGTYHAISARHLPRYLAEFDYRYNTRTTTDGERTVKAIEKVAGKRLQYRDTKQG